MLRTWQREIMIEDYQRAQARHTSEPVRQAQERILALIEAQAACVQLYGTARPHGWPIGSR